MATRTVERLLVDVNFALERGLGARDLVPMLTRLVRCAPAGSDVSRFARLQLARQLVESEPFKAATLARSVLAETEDDEAYGLLGLALTVLGHYRAAAKAYRHACRLHPSHPGHAHNLGHLLDAAFGSPQRGMLWLERAFRAAPDVSQIASSYAHALVRVGRIDQAKTVLTRHAGLDRDQVEGTVAQWLAAPIESAANQAEGTG